MSENLDLSTIPKETIDEIRKFQNELCKHDNTLCEPCGIMMEYLLIGNLKEKQIESCLNCKKKSGPSLNACLDLKGKIESANNEIKKESGSTSKVKNISEKTRFFGEILGTLSLAWVGLKNLFQKPQEGPQQ